ncbi:ABC transporter related protein [Thermaerobacter marianensis DSM 12885]|uniref:ABC transporter related protein n=1 Tax=Thermaerobacter marianensis (strain ATCC 700841 / DSM 12885 / JCM 10246 / 7p75a) TaxID=644966 RepID=E6SGF7_THEM7|nr:ATP-binding cassette domain-containing protein [Thermaerobacter marianensis]ADU51609.1 ABC transporter related protein [Thermaerobacter marianensis DSM 12885]
MEIGVEQLTVVIDGRTILNRVSLACRPGTVTALVGPSGAGKTTLLNVMGLLLRPTAGRVRVGGTDATGWGSRQRRRFWRDHAAFILQDYGVIEEESVAFNVTMRASLLRGRVAGDPERLRAVLAATGLEGREREPAVRLSGGEKRRLGVARALYKDARVIFADEPTASLDERNRARVIELLVSLARQGRTVVVATHDEAMARAADSLYALQRA